MCSNAVADPVMDLTYEQVASLELTPLRVLLRDGEPIERVWAAWALGLRLGEGFMAKELAPRFRSEPDPGVRRHLAVVLAGAGQRDGVAAIAQADPDEHVRASACALLMQTAAPAEVELTRSQLMDFMKSDGSAVVRERIIELVGAHWPAARVEQLWPCLELPYESVRAAAVRVLLGFGERTAPQLLRHALSEPVEHLRRDLLRKLDARLVCSALRTVKREVLDDVLQALRESGLRFTWRELACLATHEDPELDTALLGLMADPAGADVDFLVSRAVHALGEPEPTRRGYQVQTVGGVCLRELVERSGVVLTAAQREKLATLVPRAEEQLATRDEWFADYDDEREDYETLVRKLKRLTA